MSRRERSDPDTARLVEQRLQWLLTENGPSRPPPVGRSPAADEGPLARRGAEDADAIEEQVGPVLRGRRARPVSTAESALPAVDTGLVWRFRRPHLVIVAVIVAAGILLACWAVLRARPVAVAVTPPPVVATTPPAAAGGGQSTGPSPTAAAGPVVHVLGAVKRPGLVTLPAGSRVHDALAAAGGLTGRADPGELNLAQPVSDGQQILVGTRDRPSGELRSGGGGGGVTGEAGGGSAGQPVDLNTATQAQLEGLPGVGPVMAGKIIAWREENGRFSRVEELQEIDGVGPKTYAKLAPLCRV